MYQWYSLNLPNSIGLEFKGLEFDAFKICGYKPNWQRQKIANLPVIVL